MLVDNPELSSQVSTSDLRDLNGKISIAMCSLVMSLCSRDLLSQYIE